jgi:Na+-translocating ferredoxin:NAD+ oxidoreductase RnfC subunit
LTLGGEPAGNFLDHSEVPVTKRTTGLLLLTRRETGSAFRRWLRNLVVALVPPLVVK